MVAKWGVNNAYIVFQSSNMSNVLKFVIYIFLRKYYYLKFVIYIFLRKYYYLKFVIYILD